MKQILIALLFSGLFAACDSGISSHNSDLLVVEAFLYAGEPVTDVYLSLAIPLSSEDSVATSVSNANVLLSKEGAIFQLSPSAASGYYHYDGDQLTIEAGDQFELLIHYQGMEVSAQTIVPPPPDGIQLSNPTLSVPNFSGGPGGFGGPRGGQEQNTLTVSWDNPMDEFHFVVIESRVSGEPDYILPEFIRDRFGGFRLVAEPTNTNFHDVSFVALEVLGTHEAIVYRVNQEYADLYENREQDSRDLNEPPSNIKNGLGIFSAFNSQRAEFDVVRDE